MRRVRLAFVAAMAIVLPLSLYAVEIERLPDPHWLSVVVRPRFSWLPRPPGKTIQPGVRQVFRTLEIKSDGSTVIYGNRLW